MATENPSSNKIFLQSSCDVDWEFLLKVKLRCREVLGETCTAVGRTVLDWPTQCWLMWPRLPCLLSTKHTHAPTHAPPPTFYLARQQESPSAPKPLLKPLLTSLVTRPCLSFSIHPSFFPALARWAKRLIGTETIVQLRHNKQGPVGAVCLQAASSHTIPSFSICVFSLTPISLFIPLLRFPPSFWQYLSIPSFPGESLMPICKVNCHLMGCYLYFKKPC